MADLTALSDDELVATLVLLGEQAQEITNATACVRLEQQRRVRPPDTVELGKTGEDALSTAVAGAPVKAAALAAEAAAAAQPNPGG